MFYLLLAVSTSALVSITLKLAAQKGASGYGILTVNYILATLLSFLFIPTKGNLLHLPAVVWVLGSVSGIFFLLSFLICQKCIRVNGAILTATFMKMGIIIPLILSQILWHEKASRLQFVGIGIAILAILVLTYRPDSSDAPISNQAAAGSRFWLIILLLTDGTTSSMSKFYNVYAPRELNSDYMFITFLFAAIICAGLMFMNHESIDRPKTIYGLLLGTVNYTSSWFLLLSLTQLAAYLVYPMTNILTITLIAVISMLFLGEKLNRQQWIGIAMVLTAVVLLNM